MLFQDLLPVVGHTAVLGKVRVLHAVDGEIGDPRSSLHL